MLARSQPLVHCQAHPANLAQPTTAPGRLLRQGLPVMTSYLESALDRGLADPVRQNEELAHLYLRMALHPPGAPAAGAAFWCDGRGLGSPAQF